MKLKVPQKLLERGINVFPFQKTLIQKMLDSPSDVIYNGCEPGLGKTIQALVYANTANLPRVLIVCPASLRLNWARECDLWFMLNKNRAKSILSGKDFREVQKQALLTKGYYPSPFIISYDMLVTNDQLRKYVFKRKWDLGIFDEHHCCKSMEAKRTYVIGELIDHCYKSVLMSGTPMVRSGIDLFPALSKIVPKLDFMSEVDRQYCSDFDLFAKRFTYIHNTMYGDIYRGVRNHEQLNTIMRKGKFFFRKTQKQVLKDLPDITYNRIDLNLDIHTSTALASAEDYIAMFEQDEADAAALEHNKCLGTLRRELGMAKVQCKDLYEVLESFLDAGRPAVIFSWHTAVLEEIAKRLSKHRPEVVYGKTSPSKKQQAVDNFQNGITDVICGNIISLGTGWTLTRSCDCFFVECDWSEANMKQAIKRLHRISQKNAVTAHFFVSKNELDRRIINTIIQKQRAFDKVFGENCHA